MPRKIIAALFALVPLLLTSLLLALASNGAPAQTSANAHTMGGIVGSAGLTIDAFRQLL